MIRLLLDLDSYGGTYPLGMFPLFLKRTASVLVPRLSACDDSFPVCWRVANVTPTTKGSPCYSVADYRPISITLVLSKVFERMVLVRLWNRLCVWHTPSTVLWRMARKLELFRSITVTILAGSTIRVSSNSALGELEVMCYLF